MAEHSGWDIVFADPAKKVKYEGERYELLEGPRWHGASVGDVEAHRLGLEWIGKTVVVKAGFPLANTLMRGVVETVMPSQSENRATKRCEAVVRFQILEHFVRRRVPVGSLLLYHEDPPEMPAINPLMEADRRAKDAA